jgi:hypothetical protein
VRFIFQRLIRNELFSERRVFGSAFCILCLTVRFAVVKVARAKVEGCSD